MKLLAVEIYNFQSHEDTVIEFTDGLNGFVGPTDSGKSSIYRAIRWNTINEPSGTRFIRHGTDEARVVTKWSDGVDIFEIERIRNRKTRNFYVLYKNGVKEEEYTGFGSKVPERIKEIVQLDNDLISFAHQLEGPFLLSETPRRRAEIIGNLETLGQIDEEVSKTTMEHRELTQAEKRIAKDIVAERKQLEKLEQDILEEKDKVSFLNTLKESIEEKQNLMQRLSKHSNQLDLYQKELEQLEVSLLRSQRISKTWSKELPKEVEDIKRLMQLHNRLHQIDEELSKISYMDKATFAELQRLTAFVSEMKATFSTLDRYYDELNRLHNEEVRLQQKINSPIKSIEFKEIDLQIEHFTTLFKFHKRIQDIEKEYKESQDFLMESKAKINGLLNEFVYNLHEFSICPTCQQSTKNVTVDSISTTLI